MLFIQRLRDRIARECGVRKFVSFQLVHLGTQLCAPLRLLASDYILESCSGENNREAGSVRQRRAGRKARTRVAHESLHAGADNE